VLDGLDTARLDRVLAVKAAGAVWLDELTAGLDLDAFVLFSSAAATIGSAGQGNYAAANAFLDGLAQHRAARGLAGLSVAYGPWAGDGKAQASEAVRARLRRGPQPPMDPALAVLALAQAMAGQDSLLGIMDVDWAQFAAHPGATRLPFVRDMPEIQAAAKAAAAVGNTGEAAAGGELARRLAQLGPAEQERVLTELVRGQAAEVLGHASPAAVEADRAFSDLGFDSLTSLEMRQRIMLGTGLRLPATLVFDYPTPAALAGFLRAELVGDTDSQAESKIRKALASVPLSRLRDAGLMEALLQLADFHESADEPGRNQVDAIDALDAESLVRMAFASEEADSE
jgi:acyl carrier protein